ncbi:MAG: tRNA (adenosine(37)-N6)-threonylcarbamoyltransferase complex dimerization subunit type 1 TsaB [Chloroflexota bacterium]
MTTPADGRRPWLLAIDTATTQAVIAAGLLDGTPVGETNWQAGYRHGEFLLPSIGRLTGEANLRRSRIRGIVVGTGPGAFTGLRVGLATAKALAFALGVPIVGVPTADALLAAAELVGAAEPSGDGRARRYVLIVPAGPADRVLCRPGAPPILVRGGTEPDLDPDEVLVAIDLAGRAPDAAVELGEAARRGLATELLRIGAGRLRRGDADDLARLAPEYVTLPRGVRTAVRDDAVAVSADA